MKLGLQIILDEKEDITLKIKKVRELGFDYCQIVCWDINLYTEENKEKILSACKECGISISSFWAGWSGPKTWNFIDGPSTIGFVPAEHRRYRLDELKLGSDFAKRLGVDKVATHIGFVPENPRDPNYPGVVEAVREIADYCKANGQSFLFETGEETPITLLRLIEDTGCDNLGANYDTANLILYGKANPVDGLDILGKYVMDMHAKDGFYPTTGAALGKHSRVGEGAVDFPAIVAKLKKQGYDGVITIEREISGPQQIIDIIDAKKYLEEIIND